MSSLWPFYADEPLTDDSVVGQSGRGLSSWRVSPQSFLYVVPTWHFARDTLDVLVNRRPIVQQVVANRNPNVTRFGVEASAGVGDFGSQAADPNVWIWGPAH